jgi:hypothetical protein
MARIRTTILAFLTLLITTQLVYGQLNILSSGNPGLQWKNTQLQLIEQQMNDGSVKGPLRTELEAQKRWLSEWKSGSLSEKPWMKQSAKAKLITEPTIDPAKKASALRKRLLGPGAKPTEKDTTELQAALNKFPNDLGLRQLYLHWLDQRQYRDEYAGVIVENAVSLAGLLEQGKQTEATKLARAFCYYRAARALIQMESEESLAKKPIEDPQMHESQLLGIYNQLGNLVGHNRPEFILLEMRMLRRDNWFGRALVLLEESAEVVETKWYLTHRRDLLNDLGWNQPAKEADEIAVAFSSKIDSDLRSASRPKSEE